MPNHNPTTRRQSNGYVGEKRTEGILGRNFVVLNSSIDEDGADILVDFHTPDISSNRLRAKSIRGFGIIQAKFFEERNAVYINPEYAEDNGAPRKNFFLILHTDNHEGSHIYYFLDATEVCALPTGENRKKRFSITTDDPKESFKNITPNQIATRITRGMKEFENDAYNELVTRVTMPLRMRAAYNAQNAGIDYLLKIVSLPATDNCPEESQARIVIARSPGNFVAQPIDARWDLFDSVGTFDWGYLGEGPKLLAMSILAHYLGWNEAPTRSQHMAMLFKIISILDRDQEHTILGQQIEEALGSVRS